MSIKQIAEGPGFTEVCIGKMADLMQHALVNPETKEVMAKGKVFLGGATKATGAEISVNMMPPGAVGPFFHSHKKHEETYIVTQGTGEIQLDDKVYPFNEGTVVRVAPAPSRNLKNTGTIPLIYLCVQVEEGSLSDTSKDYSILPGTPKFTK